MVAVIRFAPAIALCVGCLGKPPFPLTDGGADAEPDAMVEPCAGRQSFPSDLVLRRVSEVGDIDRRDGGTADDVVLIGRTMNGSGTAFAYLLQGHPRLTAQCYDRRYQFLFDHDVEPIDMWLGDASGDTLPDLLLMGRETVTNPGTIETVLYAGDGTGQPETRTNLMFQLSNPFQNEWGGSVESPEPAFIVAFATAMAPLRHVFAGGLYFHPASISVTQSPVAFGSALAGTLAGAAAITNDAVQDVFVHEVGSSQELMMLTQNQLIRIQYAGGTMGNEYTIGAMTPVGPPGPRYARFARRPVDIGGVQTSIGATQRDPSGYYLMRVSGLPTDAPMVDAFTTGPGSDASLDLAIAFVDSGTQPDLIGLSAEGMDLILQVSANLDFTQSSPRADPLVELRLVDQVKNAYGILAVGDFDGNAATPDQILLISTTPGQHPTKCFQLSAGALVACP